VVDVLPTRGHGHLPSRLEAASPHYPEASDAPRDVSSYPGPWARETAARMVSTGLRTHLSRRSLARRPAPGLSRRAACGLTSPGTETSQKPYRPGVDHPN
jgi:hypothetical protein